MSEPITLSRLEVRDLGGIHRFSATLGQVAIIVGENGAGKSTLLDGIRTVLEGGSDPDMIRNGCEKAEVTVELSTGHTAHKTIKSTAELRAKLADLECAEPECTCEGNGDLADARGCEYHDPQSAWNMERAALLDAIDYAEPYRPSEVDTEYEYLRDMEDCAV